MAFPRMNEIEGLPAPERIYLANLEQALGGFVSRIQSTLFDDVVEEELIARESRYFWPSPRGAPLTQG